MTINLTLTENQHDLLVCSEKQNPKYTISRYHDMRTIKSLIRLGYLEQTWVNLRFYLTEKGITYVQNFNNRTIVVSDNYQQNIDRSYKILQEQYPYEGWIYYTQYQSGSTLWKSTDNEDVSILVTTAGICTVQGGL